MGVVVVVRGFCGCGCVERGFGGSESVLESINCDGIRLQVEVWVIF